VIVAHLLLGDEGFLASIDNEISALRVSKHVHKHGLGGHEVVAHLLLGDESFLASIDNGISALHISKHGLGGLRAKPWVGAKTCGFEQLELVETKWIVCNGNSVVFGQQNKVSLRYRLVHHHMICQDSLGLTLRSINRALGFLYVA
jgi:hypothetical protein